MMGENSKIEWTDHTFNPWWGCRKVSVGCENCYAEGLGNRFAKDLWSGKHRFFGDKHWAEPYRWNHKAAVEGVRRRVFVGSMCDVLEIGDGAASGAMADARDSLFSMISSCKNLDWLLLTKRPQNIPWLTPFWKDGWPAHVMAGTTAENQDMLNIRVAELLKAPARLLLSVEPMLGPVDLTSVNTVHATGDPKHPLRVENNVGKIGWVICGGESGPGARPLHPDWVRSLRDQCQAAGVPFYFKQWGEWVQVAQDAPINKYPTKETMLKIGNRHYAWMRRDGRKAAGRMLDGREWLEMPEVKHG